MVGLECIVDCEHSVVAWSVLWTVRGALAWRLGGCGGCFLFQLIFYVVSTPWLLGMYCGLCVEPCHGVGRMWYIRGC